DGGKPRKSAAVARHGQGAEAGLRQGARAPRSPCPQDIFIGLQDRVERRGRIDGNIVESELVRQSQRLRYVERRPWPHNDALTLRTQVGVVRNDKSPCSIIQRVWIPAVPVSVQ